jgi:hypothetical protein
MAIQNFLSGGYYGKLGATVGQRWKNKRTIRTYVIPANPRTEKQQANRGKFANAVQYSQMALQMNYYATCFSNDNYTQWNYRMKTARELKNLGLTELDLIPLYPTSFVPKTLISEITRESVTGSNHISFYTPSLTGNEDRTFSLMFALYSVGGAYIGLKLYVGYYYASNQGYIEVDVDDVAEINDKCKVRIVSNDDTDSTTDLIASPSLLINTSQIEVRDFDTAIVSFSKDSTGIEVIFNELWKGAETVNSISATVNFISNGTNKSVSVSDVQLINNNGYCSVFVPFVSTSEQYLPAFPSTANIVISSINYEGTTWEYTKTNDTIQLTDDDLSRSITVSPSWNGSSTGAITFNINFEGLVSEILTNFNIICSGRFDLRVAESQSFSINGDGEKLSFVCTGDRKNYPMMSGDRISVTALSFICSDVTYMLPVQNVELRNSILTSSYLNNFTFNYTKEGNGTSEYPLAGLYASVSILNGLISTDGDYGESFISSLENTSGSLECVSNSSYCTVEQNGNSLSISFGASFEDATNNDNITSDWIINYENVIVTYNGITYNFDTTNCPATFSGYN